MKTCNCGQSTPIVSYRRFLWVFLWHDSCNKGIKHSWKNFPLFLLFGSVVRALDFQLGVPGSIPTIGGKYFQLCFIPLLQLSCRKMGTRPGQDFIRRNLTTWREHVMCSEVLYFMYSNWNAYANSVDPDQTRINMVSDQGLHSLPLIK